MPPAVGGLVWSVPAIFSGAVLLIPVGSAVVSPIVPIALRLILAALWLAAVVRPHAALLALALLVPFGSVLVAALDAAPVQYTEALVLATLSGTLVAAARERRRVAAASPSLAPAAVVFGCVVICSLAVVLAVSQVGVGVRWLFVSNIATFLARDYVTGAPGQWTGIAAACQLLEGVLLLLLANRCTTLRVVRPLQIMKATAAAAAVAAALSLTQLASALGAAGSMRELLARILTSRISVHATDVNAAGSYYAMAGFVAIGLTLHERARGRPGRLWGLIVAAVFAALWLTGSRTAAVASAAVLACTALVARRDAWRQRPLWLIAAGAGLACAAGVLIVGCDPRAAVVGRSVARTFESRTAFITTGVRMIATAPVFGVGIGRYFEMSGRFMPSSIYWFFFHENAHNNFLQIAGELGLAGLAAFVWLLAAATVRVTRGLRASTEDRLLAGALAGLAAFVVTWMAGHPLLTPEVAFPFWILAGAAVARADGDRRTPLVPPAETDAASPSIARGTRVAVAAAMLVLIASVPGRVRRDAATLTLSEQSFGFYEWEGDAASGRARWTGRSAGFFVPAHTTNVEIPMSATFAERRPTPTRVSIAIDGRVFHRLELTNGDWITLRLRLPPQKTQTPQPRRVDIITNPPWSPAELLGTHDSRVLGVHVGEITAR